jgi:tetratricopeptide (TPR) repeat protein
MRETEHLARSKLILIILLPLVFYGKIFPQKYPDTIIDSLIDNGMKELINQDYQTAATIFENLDVKYPDLPLGKIFITAVEIAKAFDYSESIDSDSIDKNLIEAREKSKRLVETYPGNVWYRYCLGLSKGYYAYFEALNKNWFSAISNGISSESDFEKCLEIKPDFYEAYLAIGSYKYWKSRKTEFINWVPFVQNEEDIGIKDLRIAIDHPSYHRYMAIYSLIWIYIDKKQFYDAKILAELALKEFPDVRLFKWGLARAFEGIDISKSIKLYNDILISYKRIKNINHCNEIILKHIIAQLYNKMNEKQKALNLCDDILSITNLSEYEKDKLNDRLSRVRELRKELIGELSK